jgi:trimeric autotransporter adhesin
MSVIRIKRSGTNGNPSTLRAGELAYSAVTGNTSNGGDRLYIGFGPETGGNALNHFVIGGKYFTDMLDHNKGQLTANSAIVVDSNSKIDNINIGNITVTGSTNTISSTDLDGNIVFHPNGTGYTEILGTNGLVIPVGTTNQRDDSMPAGTIRYNLSLTQFEGWDGSTWTGFVGGSGGGGAAVRYDVNTQGLTATQQANARTNIGLNAGTGISYNTNNGTINVDTNTIATRSYVTGLNYITLSSLSTGTPNSPSGTGAISYSNTTGVFTYTPPDLSSYVTSTSLSSTLSSYVTSTSLSSTLGSYVTSTSLSSTLGSYVTSTSLSSTLSSYVTSTSLTSTLSSYVTSTTLSGYHYISLTSLSTGTPNAASGGGAISYSNTTGVFTYTPPDLSSYATQSYVTGQGYITNSVATLTSLTSIGSNGVDTTANGNFIVSGNLTVNGTTETVNSTTVTFADKNIELAKPVSPATASDASANGGGVTLHGTTDKTLNWVLSTTAWTSSENFDIANSKTYKINGTDVLSATALGSGVTGSSLTSVGTITSGVWHGSSIDNSYLTNTTIQLNGVTLTLGDTGKTIKASTTNALTIGTGLTGTSFDGSSAVTVAVDTTTIATRTYITGLNYITLTSLSTGTPNSASGTGAISYSNTTGVFTYTPPDLSSYVTSTSLTSTLSSYVTSTSLTSTLSSYVTSTSLSSTLSSYVTSTSLTSTLSSYVTSTSLTSTLSNYVTATTLSGYNYITLTSLSMDTPGTASGSGNVTYSNTTGKFKYTPPDLSGYLTSASTLDASKLSGTIPSSVLGNSTVYIGTTAIALNRASGSITLSGTSIDGNAGTVTNGVYTTGSYSDPSWLTISKSKVGLGNVENTALSTWAGSTNLTTLGTITTGVWHGTAITNSYLANSSITIGTTNISLGSSSTTISGLTSIDATSSSTSFFDSPTSPLLFNSGTVISIGASTGTTTVNNNLVVGGNLTVNGTTETINATTSTFADKNIELAKPVSPATASDASANGGGITLHGTTDKTLNWSLGTTSWTSSENFDLASGKTYKINGTDVLSSTTLGSGVTASSLTSVGTLTNLTVTNTISGSVSGNAGTATKLYSAHRINGVGFDGSADITITANTTNQLLIGTGLTGISFNGSSEITIAIDSTVATKTYVTGLGYITGITSTDVTTALGYTPYNSTNPAGYITSAALVGYETTAALNTTLSDYVTNTSLTSTLSGYLHQSDLTVTTNPANGSGSLSYNNGTFTFTPPDLSSFITGTSTLNAAKLSGTIPSSVLGNSTVYIGTTAIALNRTSATETLNGVSIDGNAGTVTNGVYTSGSYSDPSWLTSLAWTKISGAPTIPTATKTVEMYQDGFLVLKTGTIRWYAPGNLTITKIIGRLATPSDGTVTFKIKKNDSVTNTVDIVNPATKSTDLNGFNMVVDDYLTIDVTHTGSVNAPGAGLSVVISYYLT